MVIHFLESHCALRKYIRHYVYCEIGTTGRWTYSSMAPPGCAKLSITLGRDNISVKENSDKASRYEPIIFVGQTTLYKNLAWRDRLRLFFVIFQPYGAFPLLDIPQDECQNQCIGLSDMMGSNILGLSEQITGSQELKEIKSIIDNFFIKRIKNLKKEDEIKKLSYAIKKIKQCSRGQLSIKELCRKTGYSLSTLERHMKKIVGVTPKEFQRIIRFNRVLQYINNNPLHLNWSRIAHRFGYYDQTHFIKEFNHFYGKTPAKYTSEDNRFLSNVALERKKLINSLMKI